MLAGWRQWAQRTYCTRFTSSNPRPSGSANSCAIGLCGCGIKLASRIVFTTNWRGNKGAVPIAPCSLRRGYDGWKNKSSYNPTRQSLGNHLTHFPVRAPRSRTSHRTAARCRDRYADFNVATVDPPASGILTARTLLAEIETIHRFPHPEKLISYTGLAPRVRQSSSVDRRGPLTKRGSVWLRTALVESAQIAVRRLNQFQQIFCRVSFRRGRNVGIIATARRLAEVIWHVRSKDVLYQEPARPEKGESGPHKLPAATACPSPAS